MLGGVRHTSRSARRKRRASMRFGWGPHLCVGATLARVDVEVALQVLAERLPGLRLAPGAGITFRPGITVRMPANDFRVEWRAGNDVRSPKATGR
jgi:cytochrome P450